MPNSDPQPNKPGGEQNDGGDHPVEELAAVKNQSSVTPEDYPDDADGKPDLKSG